jgi:prepilin-type N-terminal cleavage/methylation domain-containing protein
MKNSKLQLNVQNYKKSAFNAFYSFRRQGFTLIELMVVISIIAILVGLLVANVSSIQTKSRDGARKIDIRKVQRALEQYKADWGRYPDVSGTNKWTMLNNITQLVPRYINPMPVDPKYGSTCTVGTTGSGYLYSVSADGSRYAVFTQLENPNDQDALGPKDEPSTHHVTTTHAAELTGTCPGTTSGECIDPSTSVLTFVMGADPCNGTIYNYWVSQL